MIKQEWIDKVDALNQPGRYCTRIDTRAEYRIVAKRYSDSGVKDWQLGAFLCVNHPNNFDPTCLWLNIDEEQRKN